jgi:5'-3' exonuclease
MILIFDGNYLYHRSFSIFSSYYKDVDLCEVLMQHEKQQVLIRKCVMDLCATVQRFADVEKVVVVIDNTSWRHNHHDNYKHSAVKPVHDYQALFVEILGLLEALLRKRGLIVSRVHEAEGDDLMYFWGFYYGEILEENTVIVSADADIRQLITKKVSVFNNNSKNLKMFCEKTNEDYWNDYFNEFIEIGVVNPKFITVGKAILGDAGDNIPKVKKGFGEKAFEKFYETLDEKVLGTFMSAGLKPFATYLAKNLSKTTDISFGEAFDAIKFNLEMAWLNVHVYRSIWGDDTFIDRVLSSVENEKDSYSYNKAFTLEDFYGMLLK